MKGILSSAWAALSRRLFPPRPRPGVPTLPVASLVLDDVSLQAVDVVVNAADWTMLGGTGVDGAIHERAGPSLGGHIASHRLRLRVGAVVSTPGFGLAAGHIVHACAPVYDSSDEADLFEALRLCYSEAIKAADALGAQSMAFPLLGAGAFCWPARLSAKAFDQARAATRDDCRCLMEIRMCAYSGAAFSVLQSELGLQGVVVKNPGGLSHHPGKNALEGLDVATIEKYY